MCDKRLVNIMREKINKCPALKVAYLRMFIQPLAAFTQFIENILFTPSSFKMLFMFMYHFNRHPGLEPGSRNTQAMMIWIPHRVRDDRNRIAFMA